MSVRTFVVLALCSAPALACGGKTADEDRDAATPAAAGTPPGTVPPMDVGAPDAAAPTASGGGSSSQTPPDESHTQEGANAADASRAPSGADVAAPTVSGPIWTSDDGPILGLAVDADHVFCVTQGKLTSIARDGTGARVLAQSPNAFAYSGAIATNGALIYWGVESPSAGVSSVSPDGGAAESLGAEGYSTVGIALDESSVYWMTNDSVMSAPLSGEATSTTLATLAGLSYENAFTLVGGMLYWSTNDSAAGGGLVRMPITGGTPTTLVPKPVFSLEPAGTESVAWLENPTPVLVESDPAASTLQRTALPGEVSEFGADGTRWYWRDDRTGAVYDLDRAGGAPQELAPTTTNATVNTGDGRHILVDQGQVIWADRTGPMASKPDVSVLRVIELGR